MKSLAEWPPNAVAGECYAKVYVPPKTETVSERVCVRDASERVEIIPARYEWTEDKILVKDASTELAAVPAEFAAREDTIQTASAVITIVANLNCSSIAILFLSIRPEGQ